MKKLVLLLLGTLLCVTPLAGCQNTPDSSDLPGIHQPDIPLTKIDVRAEWGVQPGKGNGLQNSLILAEQLTALQDNVSVFFPEGEYELAFPMYLIGKTNVVLEGNGVTIVRTHVSNTSARQNVLDDPAIPDAIRPYTASSSALVINDCHYIKAEGFAFKYDAPTSLSGTVVSKKGGSVTLEIDDTSDFTGEEYATVINTFTKDGVPDKTFEQYAATNFPLEKLSDNTLRVDGLDAGGVSNLRKGTRVSLRLATGNDYVINVSASTDLIFQSLTMHNSLNGGIIVGGRCQDMTVQGLTVKPENEQSLFSLNADILHISALGGSLHVENCHFERPGDDCVNVHHMAYVADSVDGKTVTVRAPRFSFDSSWARKGDKIDFYDPDTFALLGSATVLAINGNQYTLDTVPEGVGAGGVMSNQALRPQTVIQNTTVISNRARGFLLQTDNALVENCTFKDTALAAILIAPDLESWYEMSPANTVTVQKNTFENCGEYASGIIQITTNHDTPAMTYPSCIHKNITITENTFVSGNKNALYGVCIDTLTFQNNGFSNPQNNRVTLKSCKNITLDDQTRQNSTLTDVDE